MEWSRIPPLNSLRAFVALAQAGSYARAGRSLHVTHAAVNQQVRQLEGYLGVSLVVRDGRGVRLTPDGEALARELDKGFSAIQHGLESLAVSNQTRSVELTTSPAFMAEWLMPRLPDFHERFPHIALMLNPTSRVMALNADRLAVRYANHRDGQRFDVPLIVSDMVVLGAPSLLGDKRMDEPRALLALPWLQELGTNEVLQWFERHGTKADGSVRISEMPGSLITQAVRRGDGVTYSARAFFEEDIRKGNLVVLFSEPQSGIYHIALSDGPVRGAVQTVVDWLTQQAGVARAEPGATPAAPR